MTRQTAYIECPCVGGPWDGQTQMINPEEKSVYLVDGSGRWEYEVIRCALSGKVAYCLKLCAEPKGNPSF